MLFERILGRMTPSEPRFSATLIEPSIAELLRRHELSLDRVFAENADSLAQLLAARAMPIEGKRKLAAAGNALDADLTPLLEWMQSLDEGLGQSAETAAGKMRYQMNRLRRLAANFQLQREEALAPPRRNHHSRPASRRRSAGARARLSLLLRPLRFRARRTPYCSRPWSPAPATPPSGSDRAPCASRRIIAAT